MDVFSIEGGRRLLGPVIIDGSKNATLPILAATLAVEGPVRLRNVPRLHDVLTMGELLETLGVCIEIEASGELKIDSGELRTLTAPYELVRRMRASICVLGPLLARFRSARVPLPGGCHIGHRPIDLHLRGLAALGAELRIENGNVIATADRLRGAEICLLGQQGTTVTGTCNVMVAAALAAGNTVIRNAAREPEVADLARFLNSAGAEISGAGTSTIEIRGVESLHGTHHDLIPDRIEAATFAIAATVTRGDVMIERAPVEQMDAVLQTLSNIGADISSEPRGLRIRAGDCLKPTAITTSAFPGIPTDTQAQFTALLSTVTGESCVTETVFPERFRHVAELNRLGADIRVRGNTAVIHGVPRLSGAPLLASDLRASAALVLAALAAEGTSEIHGVDHLDRGYHAFEQKLRHLGAVIRRDTDSDSAHGLHPHLNSGSSAFRNSR